MLAAMMVGKKANCLVERLESNWVELTGEWTVATMAAKMVSKRVHC